MYSSFYNLYWREGRKAMFYGALNKSDYDYDYDDLRRAYRRTDGRTETDRLWDVEVIEIEVIGHKGERDFYLFIYFLYLYIYLLLFIDFKGHRVLEFWDYLEKSKKCSYTKKITSPFQTVWGPAKKTAWGTPPPRGAGEG